MRHLWTRRQTTILLALLLAGLVTVGTALLVSCGANSDGSKLKELEELQNTIPTFPSLVQISAHKDSKPTLAGISRLYKSDARYDDVRQFYQTELTKSGWECVGEQSIKDWGTDFGGRELIFKRNDYKFSVTYAGETAKYGWDYAIDLEWEK